MPTTTMRWTLMFAAVVLALGACGSDEKSSSSAPGSAAATASTAAEETPPDETTPDETVGAGEATVVESTTDATEAVTDDTIGSTETTATGGLPAAAIDDVPVCRSFSRIITTSFFIGFAGLGTEDENTGIERVEVVAYSSLLDDAATVRSDVPANLLPSIEPLLLRIDAAQPALAEGGFDDAEIVTIMSAWNSVLDSLAAGTSLADIPDPDQSLDQAKLDAAEIAFEAAVGTVAEYTAAIEASGSSMDEEGDAWLAETCPLVAAGLNES